ncbi:MAG: VWA domain-containing protein [Planctomycetaceae bacterium]|jgi:Ca-activated chloride channel family protein|nr:VWA domain-containing protein [Planctomycetaceae bacterium]
MQTDFEKLSLQKIDVTGNVLGKFSTFSIQQEYANNTDAVLEVTYTFPISATATVTGFTAVVGKKMIKGKVKEKEEAKKEYQKAMLDGNSAYMMTNDESNIFRMNIGKIAVGEIVKIKINYIDNFEIVDNQIRILIPTLVPPRYKSDVTDKLSYNKGEIEYRGNMTIGFDKDLKIDDIESKTHSIKLENNIVTAKNIKLNKDFVLDVWFVEQTFSKGYYRELPNGNKTVYLSFFPDIEEIEKQHKPKDYVFVIDISGSMEGFKLEQTKEAVIKCLKQLKAGDKFNIISFNHGYHSYSDKLVEYNAENYEKVKKFVQSLQSYGGTELLAPLQAVIPHFSNEKILFLFTDGAVGNEGEIAGYVRQNIGKNSIFIFGIDSSVNKKGLQEIAEAGRGKAEFIVKDELIKEIIVRQFARVLSANLFNITLNQKANKIINKFEKSQALFNHEFYDILIETNDIVDDFELTCKTDDNKIYSFVISKNMLEHSDLPLDKIYASEQIRRAEKYISNRWGEDNKGYKERIVEIAVEYQIDSKYTAFIAVNERDEKLTDIPELQNTVLESPEGWDMKAKYLQNQTKRKVLESPEGWDNTVYRCRASAQPDNVKYCRSKKVMSYTGNAISFNDDNMNILFEKIKECEELINQQDDSYRKLLDEIIDELRSHFSSPSKKYKKLFKKMKKETPNVYTLIEVEIKIQSKQNSNFFKWIFRFGS